MCWSMPISVMSGFEAVNIPICRTKAASLWQGPAARRTKVVSAAFRELMRRIAQQGDGAAAASARRMNVAAIDWNGLSWQTLDSRFAVTCVGRHLQVFEERSETGDEAGTTPECQVSPEPLRRNEHRRPHANQKVDMRETPEPPGESTCQSDAPEIGDRRVAADGGKITLMSVVERCRLVPAKSGRPDHVGDITPALLGGRRKTRHREIVLPSNGCGVADNKDLRISRR
jgi:hypothetical protein